MRSGKVISGGDSPFGFWTMSSKEWVRSLKLHVHIRWVLDQLEPNADALKLTVTSDATADIFCYSVGATPVAPSIPQVLRDRAASMGFRIEIDHYDSCGD